jgi:hypothetical protein
MSFLDGLNRPFFIFLVVQLWGEGGGNAVDCCNERLKIRKPNWIYEIFGANTDLHLIFHFWETAALHNRICK